MKISSVPVITESPELHRGEVGESVDPAMAFLAALGSLLPGLVEVSAVATADKADISIGLTIDDGVAPTDAAPVGGATAVLVSLASNMGLPEVAAKISEVKSDGLNGSSAQAKVPPTVATTVATTVPKQPLIAADRAGVPIAAIASQGTEVSAVKEVLAPVSPTAMGKGARPTNGSGSEEPGVKAVGLLLRDLASVPTQPLVAADRLAAPIESAPTVTSSIKPVIVVPPTPANVSPPTIASESNDESQAPVVVNPTSTVSTPNAVVTNVSPLIPKISGTGIRDSKVDTKPLPEDSEAIEVPVVKVSNAVIETKTPTSLIPTQVQTQISAIAKVVPDSSGNPESVKARAATSETGVSSELGIEPDAVSSNPSQLAASVRTEGVSVVAPAAPQRPQVAAQIAPYVTALRHEPDGTHQITVLLHPADLGQVQIVVELRAGTVNVQLSGAHDAARDALNTAMPQLRRELTDAGLSVGRTDVLTQDSGMTGGSFAGGSFSGGARQGSQSGSITPNLERDGLLMRNLVESSTPQIRRPTHVGAVDVSI